MSGIPAWAVKGAEVVCVDAVGSEHIRTQPPLEHGRTYTIEVAFYDDFTELAYVNLVDGGIEWRLDRFAPVTKRTAEQDIAEHFAGLLKVDAPEGVSA